MIPLQPYKWEAAESEIEDIGRLFFSLIHSDMNRPELNSNIEQAKGDQVDPHPDAQIGKQTQNRSTEVHPLWWNLITVTPVSS